MIRLYRHSLTAGIILIFLGFGAARSPAAIDALANAGAWRLGDQLSLAALLHAQGGQQEKVDRLLEDMTPLAGAMGIEIKAFPVRPDNLTGAYVDILDYLIKGDGAAVGTEIGTKFGGEAASLFEVSVKSNLLILLYQPGDDRGIGKVIKLRCEEIALPKELWMGVVTAIDNKASQGDVKDAIFKMHDDVANYLQQQVD